MKYPIAILALGIALLPFVSVRADEKTKFLQSVAVPLSRAETAQFESLSKAEQMASTESEQASNKWLAANTAADAASPADHAALQKKADALWERDDFYQHKWEAANAPLEKFKTSKRARLPREVRARLPGGATTLYAGRQPMGAGGKAVLIHVWTAARPSSEDSNFSFEGAPFYVDALGKGSGQTAKWQRVARATYKGSGYPTADDVEVRWLNAAKKQGPVLLLWTRLYMSTSCNVVTYPQGIGTGKTTPSYAQEFSAFGVGGGKVSFDFGVDERGTMTVVTTSAVNGYYQDISVLGWNGHEYAKALSKVETVYKGEQPIGVGGKPMLVHIWTAGRKAVHSNHAFVRSPFHVDILDKTANGWQRIAQAVYMSDTYPSPAGVSVRWLDAKKQAPVLVIDSPRYMGAIHTLITFPQGIETDKNTPSYSQEFSERGTMKVRKSYDFGADESGVLTVVRTNSTNGLKDQKTVFAWNGREYAATASK